VLHGDDGSKNVGGNGKKRKTVRFTIEEDDDIDLGASNQESINVDL